MKQQLLVSKLDAAKSALSKAEADLETAISEIRIAPRAEKTAIGDVLEDAFEKLRTARTALSDIEALIKDDAG